MKELQDGLLPELVESLLALVGEMKSQTQAINRMAESSETLAGLIYQSLSDECEDDMPTATYLSGKPRG